MTAFVAADRHGPGRPARVRVQMGRPGGTIAARPLGPSTFVLAHASKAVKGTFPLPQLPGAPLCSLQASAACVRWTENERQCP